MNDTKFIGFAGEPAYDLIIYLACLLANLEQKVLILDVSEEELLYDSIPKPLDYLGVVHYKNFDVNKHSTLGQEQFNEYNHVLVYYSAVLKREALFEEWSFDIFYLISDLQLRNLRGFNHLFTRSIEPNCVIIREVPNQKLEKEFLDLSKREKIKKELVYLLPMDELDYTARIIVEQGRMKAIGNLSKQLQNLLYDMVLQNLNVSKQTFKNAFRQGRKGRFIENSILE